MIISKSKKSINLLKKKINQIEPIIYSQDKISLKKYINSDSWYTENKITKEFEASFAQLTGSKYAVAFPNGTLTLLSLLLIMNLKKEDTVLVPSLTMVATANIVKLAGYKLDFVDISEDNLCINPSLLEKKLKNNKSIKLVIYVNFNGRSGEINKIKNICKRKKIILIEDAAHSIGSFLNKSHHGTFGIAGSFSFSTPKIITTGQGGMVVTNKKKIFLNLKKLKNFGRKKDGNDIYQSLGYNFKFTDLQATLGISQLKTLNFRIEKKRYIFKLYQKLLSDVSEIQMINFKDSETPWFVDIFVKNRDALIKYLEKEGIICRKIYPSLNKLKFFNTKQKCLVSENYSKKGIWLPSSINLSYKDIYRICDLIKKFYV